MSRIDLNEFLDAYLGEVDELVASANAQLLAIDASQRRGEATPRQVRELFRALHTIKGLSAMVGVEPIVAIAHRMEAVLRTADRDGGRLPTGAVDLLLQGVRAIEQRVRALGGGQPVPSAPEALLNEIEALQDGGLEPEPPTEEVRIELEPALGSKLEAYERESLARGVREGRRAVLARFSPSPERVTAGTNINAVRERLATVAEIVKVVPIAVPPSPSSPVGLSFALLALTAESNEGIADTTGLDPDAITTLAEPREATPEPEHADLLPEADDTLVGEDAGFRRNIVRVDVARLDDALEHFSSLILGRAAILREVQRLADRGVDTRSLGVLLQEQTRQVRDLRAAILRVRMVPVGEVLDRVPLIVRALRRATGKSVRLEIDAGRAELDKTVAERIFPAIVHLVRNAVDHAIEPAEERLRAGKPAEGLVRIECSARGSSQLELRVTDDGRGIDVAALAARAGQPIPTQSAALLQLLSRPGLTTRDEVSATSGRGMGMDIVRKVVVEQLGGELAVQTAPGQGTTFLLRIPLTISILDAFSFECGSQRFVVPLSTVDEIVELDSERIVSPPGRGSLRLMERRGESVALVQLDEVLGLRTTPSAASARALIVRREGQAMAFAIDRMLGQQEVVVRPLEDPLLSVRGIAGATDLGDGRTTLVLDLFALGARLGAEQEHRT